MFGSHVQGDLNQYTRQYSSHVVLVIGKPDDDDNDSD